MPSVLTIPPNHHSKNGDDPHRPVPTHFRTFEASVYCASSIIVIPIGLTSSTSAYLKASRLEKKQTHLPPVAAKVVVGTEAEEGGAEERGAGAGAGTGAVTFSAKKAEAGTVEGISSDLAAATSTASANRGAGDLGGDETATTTSTTTRETPGEAASAAATTAPVSSRPVRKRGRPQSATTHLGTDLTADTHRSSPESLTSISLVP